MQKRIQKGKTITLTAPYDRLSGQGALIGSIFGVAMSDVLSGVAGQFVTKDVFTLAKTSAQAWSDGDKIAWDNTNKRCDNDLSKGPCIGVACNGGAANPSSTGAVRLNGIGAARANSVAWESSVAPASYSTAGAVTYTAADILGGVIVRDTNGASRTDVLPTAALLVAAVPGAKVGDVLQCLIVNGADAAEVLTIGAGAGGGFDANQTASSRVIGQNTSKTLTVRLTNVTASSEAYAAYL